MASVPAPLDVSPKPRILIVDDDQVLARTLHRLVRQLRPSAVVEVFFDVEAPRRRVGEPFDVAILDLHVGAESGAALARDLVAASPRLKLVFVTGAPQTQEAMEARALAPVALLEKPFPNEALKAAILRALGTSKS